MSPLGHGILLGAFALQVNVVDRGFDTLEAPEEVNRVFLEPVSQGIYGVHDPVNDQV